MNDDESGDDIGELQELLGVYARAETEDTTLKRNDAVENEPTYVEVPMEKVIFGDKQSYISNLAKAVGKKYATSDNENKTDDEQADSEDPSRKRKAAWTDSDDDDLQVGDVKRQTRYTGPIQHLRKDKSYKQFLEARFARTSVQPKWASLEMKPKQGDSDESEDEPLLKTVGFIDHKAKRRQLREKLLKSKRLKDVNRMSYNEGVITSLQFHPTSTAALVSGKNGIASIYALDGTKNEKLHSIRFRKFPINCMRIAPCGTKAYFGSSMPFYYSYDLLEAKETKLKLPRGIHKFDIFEVSPCGKYIAVSGKFGAIHLFATSCNELLHSFKQEGHCRGMCFTADSQHLLTCGHSNSINILSLRQNKVVHTFLDDGCVTGQALQLAPNQRLLATGSTEGVVNVYDYESVYQSNTPMPEKRFMNLRTSISHVQFNHTSELLAMSSKHAPNALKVAHFPSATVYSNFPLPNESLGHVTTTAFSPSSGFLALGNSDGKVPLFRLHYFKNY
ncbi:U3 small nucleolar RNA-associated protein 18 homolog [Scaptodrosophila lebanonensis]|uniref:U3 small nucleolar RNA-associated protein 18 homolog n=1 Tax=Drosophila lebanonensis TaxID=7225 RepID=A0A6J2T4L3_DROLE|nr:U3 small nucleolar RNA-associated protein 18 homolog [Scaptodrosophila lebanonensis]